MLDIPHIHSHLMALYAKDYDRTDKPWLLWQTRRNGVWFDLVDHPSWDPRAVYRRKQSVDSSKYTQPAHQSLPYGTAYWSPDVINGTVDQFIWKNSLSDTIRFKGGLVYLSQSGAGYYLKMSVN